MGEGGGGRRGGGAEKRAKGGDRFCHYLIFIYDKLTNNRCMCIYIFTPILYSQRIQCFVNTIITAMCERK